MMRNNGQLAIRQILPSGQVIDTVLNGINDQYIESKYAKIFNFPNSFHRNEWWMTGNEYDCNFAIGLYGQLFCIDPSSGVVIVKFSSWPDAVDIDRGSNTFRMFAAIAAALE